MNSHRGKNLFSFYPFGGYMRLKPRCCNGRNGGEQVINAQLPVAKLPLNVPLNFIHCCHEHSVHMVH